MEASVKMIIKAMRAAFACAAVSALVVTGLVGDASAQQTVRGERYIPTIWIDPDGCEHWVMDDGAEGFMSPHLNRQGHPVCHRGEVCGVMPTDQFFATNRAEISPQARESLTAFFRQANARAYLIHGHTDSRASDEYNMRLSLRRATAVAKVAQSLGANVIDMRGFGERMPRATNSTAEGMAQNRRVEIICLR
jgi:outer membrane protein OmpA-like peptidoglycan-associated protein